MITGKTKSGFEYEIEEGVLRDYRMLDALGDIQYGNADERVFANVRLCNLLLGEEGKKRLFGHLKEPDGAVPTEKVFAEVKEIFNGILGRSKEAKN